MVKRGGASLRVDAAKVQRSCRDQRAMDGMHHPTEEREMGRILTSQVGKQAWEELAAQGPVASGTAVDAAEPRHSGQQQIADRHCR